MSTVEFLPPSDSRRAGKSMLEGSSEVSGPDLVPILTKIFVLMDADGDDHIDEKEGLAIGRALGGTTGDAAMQWWKSLLAADEDKSGTVELNEWLKFNANAYKGKEVQGHKELMMMHDRLEESIGRRTQQKSHHAAAAAAAASASARPAGAAPKNFKSLVLAIFKAIDSSGDGSVSHVEMSAFVTLLHEQAQSEPQRAAARAFAAAVDGLYQGGLVPSLGAAQFGALSFGEIEVGGGAGHTIVDAEAALAELTLPLLEEPDLLQSMLDDIHLTAGGGKAVTAAALDDAGGSKTEAMRQRFRRMDVDGDGSITRDELADMHLEMSDDQVDELFSKADVDGSGLITFDEFVKAAHHFELAEQAGLDAALDGLGI
jgi:Ca2+-binding EF-hand superfamily protein